MYAARVQPRPGPPESATGGAAAAAAAAFIFAETCFFACIYNLRSSSSSRNTFPYRRFHPFSTSLSFPAPPFMCTNLLLISSINLSSFCATFSNIVGGRILESSWAEEVCSWASQHSQQVVLQSHHSSQTAV